MPQRATRPYSQHSQSAQIQNGRLRANTGWQVRQCWDIMWPWWAQHSKWGSLGHQQPAPVREHTHSAAKQCLLGVQLESSSEIKRPCCSCRESRLGSLAPTWWLTAINTPNSRGPHGLFWPEQKVSTWWKHMHTGQILIHMKYKQIGDGPNSPNIRSNGFGKSVCKTFNSLWKHKENDCDGWFAPCISG